jgi:hypothetical protein
VISTCLTFQVDLFWRFNVIGTNRINGVPSVNVKLSSLKPECDNKSYLHKKYLVCHTKNVSGIHNIEHGPRCIRISQKSPLYTHIDQSVYIHAPYECVGHFFSTASEVCFSIVCPVRWKAGTRYEYVMSSWAAKFKFRTELPGWIGKRGGTPTTPIPRTETALIPSSIWRSLSAPDGVHIDISNRYLNNEISSDRTVRHRIFVLRLLLDISLRTILQCILKVNAFFLKCCVRLINGKNRCFNKNNANSIQLRCNITQCGICSRWKLSTGVTHSFHHPSSPFSFSHPFASFLTPVSEQQQRFFFWNLSRVGLVFCFADYPLHSPKP